MPRSSVRSRCSSGPQLLGVTRGGLHDLGAYLAAGGVDRRVSVASLVPARARRGGLLLLPVGAVCVALDLPFAVPQGPGRRLVERSAILRPINHALAGLTSHRVCGGLYVGRLA